MTRSFWRKPANQASPGADEQHSEIMHQPPSPSKSRGLQVRRKMLASAASVVFLFAMLYAAGIMPFVGVARDYSTLETDRPMFMGGALEGGGFFSRSRAATQQMPGSDVVARFHAALQALQAAADAKASMVRNVSSSGGGGGGSMAAAAPLLPTAACPADLQLGVRPALHTPDLFGNKCEPWVTRRAVALLQMLLSPSMSGLEWGAGASTAWYLSRLGRLVSIEHSQEWADRVSAVVARAFEPAQLAARWELHVAPPKPAQPVLTFAEAESYERFKPYVDAAFLERAGRPQFDFIAIDGQARVACFQRALWMLKSHGGVLLLNSAARRGYAEVFDLIPRHWLRFSEEGQLGSTAIWVSCEAGRCGGSGG